MIPLYPSPKLVWQGTEIEGPMTFYRELWVRDLIADADRRDWLEDVRSRLGLVTIDGGLPRRKRAT